ncbi:PTS IIA-like nitrogen-regulatory protein PtsN [Sphingomonas guangdongensis]|uniref:PTS IIA-like nitrogen-regulatory protein PtsN n=1 Tax=Sphingomonas guangdongensis TaxID=1141890 RepID=A0A285QF67_9SPHN|nr:PTS sugar transporter subunit IIA [Sphingomonas guangdongensis]SOB80461.1 PTS IIA-like nitrogen-regulatory protein PtsN [Sphingomonas guangdongensis]
MTELGDLLALDAVLPSLAAANKRALFAGLGTAAAQVWGLNKATVSERLSEREKLGTTGYGNGIAVPHARIEGLTQVRGLFVRLPRPIDYAAVDELPVDLFFVLLSPTDAGTDHLKALARVSRRLRERGFADKLRGAGSRDALFVLLTGDDVRDAA